MSSATAQILGLKKALATAASAGKTEVDWQEADSGRRPKKRAVADGRTDVDAGNQESPAAAQGRRESYRGAVEGGFIKFTHAGLVRHADVGNIVFGGVWSQETKIGLSVGKLRQNDNSEVASLAKELVKKVNISFNGTYQPVRPTRPHMRPAVSESYPRLSSIT